MPQERTSKLRRSKGIPKVRQSVNQCLCDGSQERKENKEVHGQHKKASIFFAQYLKTIFNYKTSTH